MSQSRSPVPLMGAAFYLLAFVVAVIYTLFTRETFSGLPAVMLAWPWIDYLPKWHYAFLIAVALNAIIIYIALALFVAIFG